MIATTSSEDRAINAALAMGDNVSSAVRELVDIIGRLDAEIAKRDERIEELERGDQ